MMDTAEKAENVWGNRIVKFIVIIIVFPILVIAFSYLLLVPAFFVQYLLVHVVGHLIFWSKTLSVVALIGGCWGAYTVCKLIWPHLK